MEEDVKNIPKEQIEDEFRKRGYPIHLTCDAMLSERTANALRDMINAAIKHVEAKDKLRKL